MLVVIFQTGGAGPDSYPSSVSMARGRGGRTKGGSVGHSGKRGKPRAMAEEPEGGAARKRRKQDDATNECGDSGPVQGEGVRRCVPIGLNHQAKLPDCTFGKKKSSAAKDSADSLSFLYLGSDWIENKSNKQAPVRSCGPRPAYSMLADAMPLLTPTSGPPTNPPQTETTVVVYESAGGASRSPFDWSKLAEMAQQAAEVSHTWSSEVEHLKTNLAEEKDKNERLNTNLAEGKAKNKHLKTILAEEKDKNDHLKTNLAEEKNKNEFLRTTLAEEKHKYECLKTMLADEKDKNLRLKTNLADEKDENERHKTMLVEEKDKYEHLQLNLHPRETMLMETEAVKSSKLAEMAQQALEVSNTWSSEIKRLKTLLVEEKDKNKCLKIMLMEEKNKNECLKTNLAEEKFKNKLFKYMLEKTKDKNLCFETNLADKYMLEKMKDKNLRFETNLADEKDESELLTTMCSRTGPHPLGNTLTNAMPLLTLTSGPPVDTMTTITHESTRGHHAI
ncbi:uncharacterized protein LOC127757506 isoform X1 [Oryza glaberrima]|uniref:uncharacterized protein LOC127757506 isoform X1 n=2 Tax=Oryza glaberrima TaxID=4538 RepID=UPI00224C0A11|nr:uncharacterized protein LOC127757506 isoform X1 [Oryza glaberrima]